jgi:hypothetical protein
MEMYRYLHFLLLLSAGIGFRLTLSWILRAQFNLELAISQALAAALLVFACLPSWLQPITFPIPLGVTFTKKMPNGGKVRRPTFQPA